MILVDVYRKHSKNIVGIIIALWVLLVNVSGNFTKHWAVNTKIIKYSMV